MRPRPLPPCGSKLEVTARVLRDGRWQGVPARELVTGDVVRVRAGDFVPADLQLFDGALRIDQSALTGESLEVDKTVNQALYAGSNVRDGEATGIVVATGARTYFGRTTQLVLGAHPKLHVEEVISRVVRWLLVIVAGMAAVTFLTAVVHGQRLVDVLPITLVLLMSAVPVALPVMFTVSMAVGSMELGRRGVLITRLSAIEDAANMDVLCADKTGTLTMNRLSLTGAVPQPGFTETDVVRAGALASNEANADPIDVAFLDAARDRKLDRQGAKTLSFEPFSAKTRRTAAVVDIGGQRTRVVKGALRTVAEAVGLDASAIAALEERADEEAQKGVRALAVARADGDGPLRLCGLALLYDAPRPESRRLIDELRALGHPGRDADRRRAPGRARDRARARPGRDHARPRAARGAEKAPAVRPIPPGGGFAEVFPEDKFLVVKRLQAAGHVVGMTGDGVNDAPALRQAEVGIAVSGATDVAKGAASAVLTTDGLANIVDLVKSGRATYQRMLTWIVNKVSRTILKAGFVVIAFLVTGKFVISALVMLLVVCFTDVAHIALATDRVQPSQKPETWNIGPLVRVAVVLGVLTLIESLGLLAVCWRRLRSRRVTPARCRRSPSKPSCSLRCPRSSRCESGARSGDRAPARPSPPLSPELRSPEWSSGSMASPSSRRSRSPRASSSSATPRSVPSVRTIGSRPSSSHVAERSREAQPQFGAIVQASRDAVLNFWLAAPSAARRGESQCRPSKKK